MSERRFPYLNQATVCGVVSRKPSLRTNKSGVATLKVSLTVSLPTLTDDLKSTRLSTVRVPVFIVGSLAVACETLLATGSEIVVDGWLSSPPARGSASRLEVHAERVQVVDENGVLRFVVRGAPAEESTAEEQMSVDEQPVQPSKRPTRKRAAPKSKQPSETTATQSGNSRSDSQSHLKSKPEPTPTATPTSTHGRRKRPVEPTLSSADENVVKSRRRRASSGSTRRSSSAEPRSVRTQVDTAATQKDSVSQTPEESKPATRTGKPSPARKPSTRRVRRKTESATDDKKMGAGQNESQKKARREDTSGAKSKKKSDVSSPFELVETDDSFDPFLLEE